MIVKDGLENYLSKRTNELFDLEDKIILYDLTNTYFEGRMKNSKTLETIVDALSNQTSFAGKKPIVVIDAGIATDENLKLLKKKH